MSIDLDAIRAHIANARPEAAYARELTACGDGYACARCAERIYLREDAEWEPGESLCDGCAIWLLGECEQDRDALVAELTLPTLAEADASIRAAGGDPEAIGRRGAEHMAKLIAASKAPKVSRDEAAKLASEATAGAWRVTLTDTIAGKEWKLYINNWARVESRASQNNMSDADSRLIVMASPLAATVVAMADEIEALRGELRAAGHTAAVVEKMADDELAALGRVIKERDEAQERAMNLAALLVSLRDGGEGRYFLTHAGNVRERDHACAECVGADDILPNCVGFQCAYHKLIATVGPFKPLGST